MNPPGVASFLVLLRPFPSAGAASRTGQFQPNRHDVMACEKQLGERSSEGNMLPYRYGMWQIGHEMGHRWCAFVRAKVNGEIIELGPMHLAPGIRAAASPRASART